MSKLYNLYRCKIQVDPSQAELMADRIRAAGASDVIQGTTAIWFNWSGDTSEDAQNRFVNGLNLVHQTTFGVKPQHVIIIRQYPQ